MKRDNISDELAFCPCGRFYGEDGCEPRLRVGLA